MRRFLLSLILASTMGLGSALAEDSGSASGKRWLVGFKPDTTETDKQLALSRAGFSMEADLAAIGVAVVSPKIGMMQPSLAVLGASAHIDLVFEDFYAKWIEAEGPEAVLSSAQTATLYDLPMPSLKSFLKEIGKLKEGSEPRAPQREYQEAPWGIRRVHAPEAWELVGNGRGVKVAVIDTGIDASHPELAAAVAGGYNATRGSKDAWRDDNGHGTHVSGTIAAVRDGKGVVGVAPGVRLYAVKVLDKDGGGFISDILKGIVWSAQNGMQVANMSLGSGRSVIFLKWAVEFANARGMTIVAAAGNSGGSVGYPAAYAQTIAVSALDESDAIADFSSRGRQVAFIAPGVDVVSSVPGGGYGAYSGTSMATPHMTGLAALAISLGYRGSDQVRTALMACAVPVKGLTRNEQGAGVVDARLLKARR